MDGDRKVLRNGRKGRKSVALRSDKGARSRITNITPRGSRWKAFYSRPTACTIYSTYLELMTTSWDRCMVGFRRCSMRKYRWCTSMVPRAIFICSRLTCLLRLWTVLSDFIQKRRSWVIFEKNNCSLQKKCIWVTMLFGPPIWKYLQARTLSDETSYLWKRKLPYVVSSMRCASNKIRWRGINRVVDVAIIFLFRCPYSLAVSSSYFILATTTKLPLLVLLLLYDKVEA